jgi:hypothetical protein
MPCPHKFRDELDLLHLDYEPETLIVGTFNPAWPAENTAQWFYGRTHDAYRHQSNNFWEVLPRVYGEESLINAGPVAWKAFCRRHRVAITDLIAGIVDADEGNAEHVDWLSGFSDQHIAASFAEHEFVDIPAILRRYPAIQNIYLTRGAWGFWKKRWAPVQAVAMQEGKYARTFLTPSDWARIQHRVYNRKNPGLAIATLPDFIGMRWKAAWHF